MRSGVRSRFLLPGIKEAELKFILFVVCQPISVCVSVSVESSTSTSLLNVMVLLVGSKGHCRDGAEAGWCSELMKLRSKV